MTARKNPELRSRLGDPSKGAEPTKAKRLAKQREITDSVSISFGITTTPPETLDAEGRQVWNDIVASSEWLVSSDRPALTLLCKMHSRVNVLLDREGDLKGNDISIIKTYMDLISKFGLNPHSRLSLGLAVAETQSKLDAFRSEN